MGFGTRLLHNSPRSKGRKKQCGIRLGQWVQVRKFRVGGVINGILLGSMGYLWVDKQRRLPSAARMQWLELVTSRDRDGAWTQNFRFIVTSNGNVVVRNQSYRHEGILSNRSRRHAVCRWSTQPNVSDQYMNLHEPHAVMEKNNIAWDLYQFHKIHSHAHSLNLRTVILHRRDYEGSTPYSPEELEELEQGSVVFWERLSAQIAEFLEIFIMREKIPKLTRRKLPFSQDRLQLQSMRASSESVGGRSGGVAIFGWSAGCSTVLSFLGASHNPMISQESYKLLEEYIGNCILYDPTYLCFGYTLPSDNRNYIPWADPTVAPEDIPRAVSEWVSSYYDHPCYDPISGSLPVTATIHDLDGTRTKSDEITISSWTDEELVKGIEGVPAKNEMLAFQPPVQNTLRLLSDRAFFDQTNVTTWFPDVDVLYLGGTRSNWMCAWGEIETKKRYLQARSRKDSHVREVQFFDMDGLNHLVGYFLNL
ncbi:hypothetical protein HHX47_DHR9000168 [Lentinula edodes]|nr:hypothetical protein HHX47_DHR9000168 [Lentinula edodes]